MPAFPDSVEITNLRQEIGRFKRPPRYMLAQLETLEIEQVRRRAALAQKYWDFIHECGHLRELVIWDLRREGTSEEIISMVAETFGKKDELVDGQFNNGE